MAVEAPRLKHLSREISQSVAYLVRWKIFSSDNAKYGNTAES